MMDQQKTTSHVRWSCFEASGKIDIQLCYHLLSCKTIDLLARETKFCAQNAKSMPISYEKTFKQEWKHMGINKK